VRHKRPYAEYAVVCGEPVWRMIRPTVAWSQRVNTSNWQI